MAINYAYNKPDLPGYNYKKDINTVENAKAFTKALPTNVFLECLDMRGLRVDPQVLKIL